MRPRLRDLNDPTFLRLLEATFPDGNVTPDDRDYDKRATPRTDAEAAEEYRLAVARRVLRLWWGWKAAQN
jgi:hypothetical protein